MKSRIVIVASTPAWNERSELLARCLRSARGSVDRHRIYRGGIRRLGTGLWETQATMRDAGRAWAVRWARARCRAEPGRRGEVAVWLLQLDADESLVHGELLRPILERWPHAAYPLPLVQEDGQTTLAPFKLFRARGARIVACSEYIRWGGPIYNLAGYSCPPELRDALLELPFLLHTPGLRGPGIRTGARLSLEELAIETRPANAVQWVLPPLTLNRRTIMAEVDAGGSVIEYDASDGDYACPECGRRYDTPGLCEGHEEAGHAAAAVAVVKVKSSSSSKSKSKSKSAEKDAAELEPAEAPATA